MVGYDLCHSPCSKYGLSSSYDGPNHLGLIHAMRCRRPFRSAATASSCSPARGARCVAQKRSLWRRRLYIVHAANADCPPSTDGPDHLADHRRTLRRRRHPTHSPCCKCRQPSSTMVLTPRVFAGTVSATVHAANVDNPTSIMALTTSRLLQDLAEEEACGPVVGLGAGGKPSYDAAAMRLTRPDLSGPPALVVLLCSRCWCCWCCWCCCCCGWWCWC